ncbi:MAG TPA: lantibiotic dehydratase [Chthonomonadaceae bacterium]|nr:lantibiotic dehydratase [Chthonomonadaceae bacterium]
MDREKDLEAAGFFVLRTPLLPFEEFEVWSEGLEAPQACDDPARLESVLAADRERLRERLCAALARPEVREAIFVASPDLDAAISLWMREPESEKGQRAERALTRYFARMAGRATPFGLFAGASVGTIGKETRLRLPGRARYQRHTRLDMDYLCALTDALGQDPDVRRVMRYFPNTSLYTAAGRLRYVETRLEDKARTYHLVAVEATDYLEATLARARQGATLAALAAPLVEDDITWEEAEAYVEELIDSQILVPEIAPPVTGPEPIHPLIAQWEAYPETQPAAAILNQVRAELAGMDAAGLGLPPARYRAIAEMLETLPAKVELPRLFQVDMVKPASKITLGAEPVAEILRGAQLLHRLAGRFREDLLTKFQEAFTARYEGREVPLLEALDEEVGVGLPGAGGGSSAEAAPLLKGLAFPTKTEETARWGARERILLEKLAAALASGAPEIVLEPQDVEAMAGKEPAEPLPDSFAVMASLAAESEEALARGDFQVSFDVGFGPSGARLLGRFCHADPELRRLVEQQLRTEEALHPEAVFAEIVHLPEGRIGNVLCRPVLREREIVYLGASGAPPEQQIPIEDLRVSVREGRIVLCSERLDCEVIPRLTTAHNYTARSLGVYRFLCSLQEQAVTSGVTWSWGALESAPFLPQVRAGRLVLSRARWRVRKEELQRLNKLKGGERFAAVQGWRAERRLPRRLLLADADNTLPVDLDNVFSVEAFLAAVAGREEAALVEPFPASDRLCAHGPEGRFVHELVVPFLRRPAGEASSTEIGPLPSRRRTAQESTVVTPVPLPRTLPPGSDWLYAKLYSGTATADAILREAIAPLAKGLLAEGAADVWFFLRYADPEPHLRVRFQGTPESLRAHVLPALQAVLLPLVEEGRAWRLQFDTYEREVERYGGPEGIPLAERMFWADSEAALEILRALTPGDAGLEERWRLALRGADLLLADFGLDLEQRWALMKQARQGFAREFRADTNLERQLGDRFREERRSLEGLLDPANDAASPLAAGLAALHRRSERLTPIITQWTAAEQAGRLTVSRAELLPSLIHMQMNRLLRGAQRMQELVLYDFLARLYESQVARQKKLRG